MDTSLSLFTTPSYLTKRAPSCAQGGPANPDVSSPSPGAPFTATSRNAPASFAGAPSLTARQGRGAESRDATWAAPRASRPARRQRACVNDNARARRRQCARAAGRCACAKGGPPEVTYRRRGFLRGRALPPRPRLLGAVASRRMWSPVVGCGLRSAPLPCQACRRTQGCKPLRLRCCVQRARGQRAVSSWARERGSLWASGISPRPLPERGDPRLSRSSRASSLQAAATAGCPWRSERRPRANLPRLRSAWIHSASRVSSDCSP